MQRTLAPAERLIVAADFRPPSSEGREWVRNQVLDLASRLRGTGVCLKVNSALRACGYELIYEIQSNGLRVFADLKLFDIPETLSTDGELLSEANPDLLTVACSAGIKSLTALKVVLPKTEVLGVTVLTHIDEGECFRIHNAPVHIAIQQAVYGGLEAGVDGFIASGAEASVIRDTIGPNKTINTPAIRPTWAIVPGDDQNPERIMTPANAIKAGADRIVVGRPIVKAEKPYDAVMRTIEEIALAI